MNERLRAHFVRPALALLVLGLVLVGNKNPAHSAGPSNATYAHLADSGPSARQSMGMANDATTGQIVLFGGYVFSEDQLAAHPGNEHVADRDGGRDDRAENGDHDTLPSW